MCSLLPFPPSLLLFLFFFLYLNKSQNPGLPRRRCQGSWESSCEMMRKQAKPPSTQSSPINWKWGGDLKTQFHFLLLTKLVQQMQARGYQHPRAGVSITSSCICVLRQQTGPGPQPPRTALNALLFQRCLQIPSAGRKKGSLPRDFMGGDAVCVSCVLPLIIHWDGTEKVSLFHFFLSQWIKISSHLFEPGPGFFASKTFLFSFYLKNDFNGLIFDCFLVE